MAGTVVAVCISVFSVIVLFGMITILVLSFVVTGNYAQSTLNVPVDCYCDTPAFGTSGKFHYATLNCTYDEFYTTLRYPSIVPWAMGVNEEMAAGWASQFTNQNTTCYVGTLNSNGSLSYNVQSIPVGWIIALLMLVVGGGYTHTNKRNSEG